MRNGFDDSICSAIERTDGDALWDWLSFVVMLEGGVMHEAQ